MQIRRFIYDNFLAIMAALSLLMCGLSAAGYVPQNSWKDTPRFYGVMCVVWALAAILLRPPKPTSFTDEELANMSQLRIKEITGWLKERIPWQECSEWDANDSELTRHAEELRTAGAELWIYDSGPESWDTLGGERGYAIVQQTKVVDFWTVEES